MKRSFGILLIATFLVTAPMILMAQQPPHPNGGNAPGSGNGPVGGGAPIENGLTLLIALGVIYGACKFYQVSSKTSIAE